MLAFDCNDLNISLYVCIYVQQLRCRIGGRQIGNIFMWVSVIRVACPDMTQ